MPSLLEYLKQKKQSKGGGFAQQAPTTSPELMDTGALGEAVGSFLPEQETPPPAQQPQPGVIGDDTVSNILQAEPAPEVEKVEEEPRRGLPEGEGDSDLDPEELQLSMKGDVETRRATPVDPAMKSYQADILAAAEAFDKKRDRALAAYQATTDKLAQKQLWEGLINGLGMIAAGMYGLNTGSDMSGVKFSKSNWEEKLNRAERQLDRAIKTARVDEDTKRRMAEFKYQGNQKLLDRIANEAYRKQMLDMKKEEAAYKKQKDAVDQQLQAAKIISKQSPEAAKAFDKFMSAYNNYGRVFNKDDEDKELDSLQNTMIAYNNQYKAAVGRPILPPKYLANVKGWWSDNKPTPEEIGKGLNMPIMEDLEPKIEMFMKANNISDRDSAIQTLKAGGKIPQDYK